MKWIVTVLFALLSPAAFADSFPALYDVSGVASNDVLNIRARPSGSGDLTGSLAHDAQGVEIVRLSDSGTWGLVNAGESAGWVSMRYMARRPGQDPSSYPLPAQCFGTEPFWDLSLTATSLVFNTMDGQAVNLVLAFPSRTNTYSGSYAFLGYADPGTSTGIIRRAACSDGMSDREFGLSVDFLYQHPSGLLHYSGCCSLGG